MNVLTSLIIAFAMYSRIPMIKINWTEERMKYSMAFFPFIGVVIGGLEVFWFFIYKTTLFNNIFYAAVGTAIPVIITGGIHMDGYCDTVDALSSMQPKEKKIEILKDSNAGAFAVIWTSIFFLVYFGAMSMVDTYETVICISAGYVISRAMSGIAAIYFNCANKKGSLAAFSTAASRKIVSIVLAVFVIACDIFWMTFNIYRGIFICFIVAALFAYYYMKSKKEFGGITGDLAGWFTVKCELAIILACVIWPFIENLL